MPLQPTLPFDGEGDSDTCNRRTGYPWLCVGINDSWESCPDEFVCPFSQQCALHELSLAFNGATRPLDRLPSDNLTSSFEHMPGCMLVRVEAGQLDFSEAIPATPVRQSLGMSVLDDLHIIEMGAVPCQSVPLAGRSTPLPAYSVSPQTSMGHAPFPITPTNSLVQSEVTDSSLWSSPSQSLVSVTSRGSPSPMKLECLEMDQQAVSPLEMHPASESPSPTRIRSYSRMMAHEFRRGSNQSQRAHTWPSRRVPSSKAGHVVGGVVRRATHQCDYSGCRKAFRRREHLKRHKQTCHGEGPNCFSCEFCGKDKFNRLDNLNSHRKLHSRHKGRNSKVAFIPAAVSVIEKEELQRRRRQKVYAERSTELAGH